MYVRIAFYRKGVSMDSLDSKERLVNLYPMLKEYKRQYKEEKKLEEEALAEIKYAKSRKSYVNFLKNLHGCLVKHLSNSQKYAKKSIHFNYIMELENYDEDTLEMIINFVFGLGNVEILDNKALVKFDCTLDSVINALYCDLEYMTYYDKSSKEVKEEYLKNCMAMQKEYESKIDLPMLKILFPNMKVGNVPYNWYYRTMEMLKENNYFKGEVNFEKAVISHLKELGFASEAIVNITGYSLELVKSNCNKR